MPLSDMDAGASVTTLSHASPPSQDLRKAQIEGEANLLAKLLAGLNQAEAGIG